MCKGERIFHERPTIHKNRSQKKNITRHAGQLGSTKDNVQNIREHIKVQRCKWGIINGIKIRRVSPWFT